MSFLEVVLKVGDRYIKLEADKSVAVGEQAESNHELEDDDLSNIKAESGVKPLDETVEVAEVVATDLKEPSRKNSRRRQVTVHVD